MLRHATIAVLFAAIFVASGPAVALAGICAQSNAVGADPCCCPQADACSTGASLAIPDCCLTDGPPALPPAPATPTPLFSSVSVDYLMIAPIFVNPIAKGSEVIPSRQASMPADIFASTVLRC